MRDILKSASKIVFILLTLTACAGFIMERLTEANFFVLVSMAFTFYFTHKGDKPDDTFGGK